MLWYFVSCMMYTKTYTSTSLMGVLALSQMYLDLIKYDLLRQAVGVVPSLPCGRSAIQVLTVFDVAGLQWSKGTGLFNIDIASRWWWGRPCYIVTQHTHFAVHGYKYYYYYFSLSPPAVEYALAVLCQFWRPTFPCWLRASWERVDCSWHHR